MKKRRRFSDIWMDGVLTGVTSLVEAGLGVEGNNSDLKQHPFLKFIADNAYKTAT